MANYKNKEELALERVLKVLEKTDMKKYLRTEEDYEPIDYIGNKLWIEIDYNYYFEVEQLNGYACVCVNLTKKEVSIGTKHLQHVYIVNRDKMLNEIALFVNRVDNLGQEIAKEFGFKFVG